MACVSHSPPPPPTHSYTPQIQSLRTAFTLNTALKRLFLSQTALTSAGAIALAEFLPESASLLHLDLTLNEIDLAGVMALSSGLKANRVMRCLDVNVPPGDEQFARWVSGFSIRTIADALPQDVQGYIELVREEHGGGGEGVVGACCWFCSGYTRSRGEWGECDAA